MQKQKENYSVVLSYLPYQLRCEYLTGKLIEAVFLGIWQDLKPIPNFGKCYQTEFVELFAAFRQTLTTRNENDIIKEFKNICSFINSFVDMVHRRGIYDILRLYVRNYANLHDFAALKTALNEFL